MKNLAFTSVFIVLLAQFLFAQDFEQQYQKNNIIFGEAFGNGIMLSLNYERFLTQNLSIRTGFGTGITVLTSVPLMLNYYFGEEKKLELGAEIVYVDYFEKDSFLGEPGTIIITSTIGHSYQPLNGGFIVRFSFTPIYIPMTNRFIPFAGISAGYKF